MGGNLWLDLCLLIKGFFVNFSEFGHWFLRTQKRLPISKTPCITPWKLFFVEKNDAQNSGFAVVKKVPSPWKKIFLKKKKSFQLICTDKTYKTVCRNFLKINGCQVFRWGTHLYVSLFPSICLSIVHHFSGTVHHQIIIFDTHV